MNISVFGIGKLGYPIMACLARKFTVIGYDVNPQTVDAVNQRLPIVCDNDLAGLLKQPLDMRATTDPIDAIANSACTFIVVPTPSDPEGGFSTEYVEATANQIAVGISQKVGYHLIVLTSTVMPRSTDYITSLLEKGSGKIAGKDFGVCYSPEFVALGSVVKDFLNPDVILIGESDPKAGDMLEGIYIGVCENAPPIVRMSIHSAELAKISLNAFVTMKISFANTIAELCEHLPDSDSESITDVLGHDSRIGRKYLSGAMAYGGPCFPRDNRAFALAAKHLGCQAELAKATDMINLRQNDRIVCMIRDKLRGILDPAVSILGLTYKTHTDVIEESAPIAIAEALLASNIRLSVYDPFGMENAKSILGDDVYYAPSINTCVAGTDLCILSTPWPVFEIISQTRLMFFMRRPSLLDCWRMFDPNAFDKMDYTAIGIYKC